MIIALIITSIVCPAMVIAAFLIGHRLGQRMGAPEGTARPIFFTPRQRGNKNNPEQQRQQAIWDNIDNYGTDIPQREVM